MKRDITLSMDLRLAQQRLDNGAWVLSPQGAIDSSNSEEFKNRLQNFLEEKKGASDLLFDMSAVKYISSIGLGALLHLLRKTRVDGGSLALYNPQLAVRRVLEISKLDFLLLDPSAADKLGPFSEYVLRKEAERKV